MRPTIHTLLRCLLLLSLLAGLSACRTSAPRLDYKALAKASVRLGMDIGLEDNHRLYIEASHWIGTPYRSGGSSRRGTDCSGLTMQLYRSVYRLKLPAAPMVSWKQGSASDAATCAKATWCSSAARRRASGWHTWASTSKTDASSMPAPAAASLSAAFRRNIIASIG